jgi:hypothetical protein
MALIFLVLRIASGVPLWNRGLAVGTGTGMLRHLAVNRLLPGLSRGHGRGVVRLSFVTGCRA